jgi:putative restriction endonuclease
MARQIIFGEIEGINEGDLFDGRKEMMPTSFHRSWGKGIDGNGKEGASAIVLSGGYKDDFDKGKEIVYTGAGGKDLKGKWVKNQSWDNTGNAALLTSEDKGYLIRVIRGSKHKSEFSPSNGYKYAGLLNIGKIQGKVDLLFVDMN